jgi:hypothetical protein
VHGASSGDTDPNRASKLEFWEADFPGLKD